ncbi:MAG: hypothetical protein K8L97_04695 [Anaerolineae bacterium]|nr:hypothetical protein [Anaerolineae bacterium]
MHRMRFLLLVIVLCTGLSIAHAQDSEPVPLLDMLALVPDTESIYQTAPIVSYADYDAVAAARGIDSITPQEILDRAEISRLWLVAMSGVYSGFRTEFMLKQLETMQTTSGFVWTDVNQVLTFGQPPAMGQIFAADFDPTAISDAFAARGFSSEQTDDVTLICGPDGCDSGLKINLIDRDPAVPFGGELGRKEPLAVVPGYLFNSPDIAVVNGILDARAGEQPSLAANPYFSAAAHAVIQTGIVRQAQFFSITDVGFFPPLTSEQSIVERDPVTVLPPYTLATFADTYQGDEQYVIVALVYDDAEVAKQAAVALDERAAIYESRRVLRPLTEILEAHEAALDPAYVIKDAETGKATVMLVMRYPMPPDFPDTTFGDSETLVYRASGLLFSAIINDVYARAFTLIGVDLPSD